ncbi:RNA-guided endonuclease InsQ/TnpB family protein [Baaleninema simplex]|uniref:RNA-guided endonuclease InsQ/TnpB family protein n=1 Tax=Baaleninema simplex TaxID=2862350 RepID=UPI00034A284C|nr:RNA-guided endonuclease TnpB family protein [Baaleninema simplex]
MKARYQYRFYPTDQQKQSLACLFGCVRVVYNDALAICKQSEKKPKSSELQKIAIAQAKKTEARAWLSEVSNIPLQQSVADLETAFKNFFGSCKGKRKGRKVGYPKFKKRTNSQSARFRIGGFSIKDKGVYLAKIGVVKPVWSRELPASPTSVTVIKDCANRYFLSFVVEVEPISIDAKNQSIGIDLGIKTFAVMSNGEKTASPCYKHLDRKLRKLQRKLARQQKDSKRRNKTRIQIAKLHNQIADTRQDFLHKLSTKVVSENQTIILEDLNVSGMVKNRKLSRIISQQGWREFRVLVEAKSEKYGRKFVAIGRWEPTSQTCSNCGYRWGKIDLSVRSVICLNCGTEHDRDDNASKNIEMVGMGHRHDLKCTSRDGQTTSVAQLNEA